MWLTNFVIVKGVEELVAQFTDSTSTAGFMSVVVALCYWATVYALELLPRTVVFTPTIRKFLSDYAYPVSPLVSTGFFQTSDPIHRYAHFSGPALCTSVAPFKRPMC